MDRTGTGERLESASNCRALVVCETGHHARFTAGRPMPMAGFLTQLILGADPSMRSSRSERTRAAVSIYAQSLRRCA